MPTTVAAVAGPPAPAAPTEADTLIAKARAAMTRNDLEGALAQFEKALALEPGHETGVVEFVNLLLRMGDNGRALVVAAKGAEAGPRSAVLQRVYGTAQDRMGRMAEAEATFRRSLEMNPKDAEARYGLGVVLFRTRKFDAAIEQYAEAVRLDPRPANYWNNWGCALLELGRFQDAAEKLARALEIDPQDALAWNNLGSSLERSGRRPEAIDCYAKAVTLEPAYARAHQRMVQVLMDSGLFVEAVERLQHAATVVPGPERLGMANQMARIRAACPDLTLRDSALAVRIAEGLIRDTEQRSFEAYDTLGIALAADGQFEKAIEAADKALELTERFKQEKPAAEIRARRVLYAAGTAYLLPDLVPPASQPASQPTLSGQK